VAAEGSRGAGPGSTHPRGLTSLSSGGVKESTALSAGPQFPLMKRGRRRRRGGCLDLRR